MKKLIKSSVLAVTLVSFLAATPGAFGSEYIDEGNGVVFFTNSTPELNVYTQSSNSKAIGISEKESLNLDSIDAGNSMVFFTDSTSEVNHGLQSSNTPKTATPQNEIVAIDDIASGHGVVFY